MNHTMDGSMLKAFTEFKKSLLQLPILQAPWEGETLTMYVAASETKVSMVLFTDKEQ